MFKLYILFLFIVIDIQILKSFFIFQLLLKRILKLVDVLAKSLTVVNVFKLNKLSIIA